MHLEHFKVLQLAGFVFLVFGTLVYNEIVVLPFLGFNLYTRTALAQKEKENEHKGLLDNSTNKGDDSNQYVDYMATSPHATYDA